MASSIGAVPEPSSSFVQSRWKQLRSRSPVSASKMPCNGASLNCDYSMQTPFIKTIAAGAFAVCLIAGSASAQGKGNDKDKGNGKGDEKHGEVQQQVVVDQHHANDPRHVVVVDQHHASDPRHVVVTTSNGEYRRVPPGLAKKGGMPPGLAKKYNHTANGIPVMRDVFVR